MLNGKRSSSHTLKKLLKNKYYGTIISIFYYSEVLCQSDVQKLWTLY